MPLTVLFLCEREFRVSLNNKHTHKLAGPSEEDSAHKLGSHRHALFGLNSVGPTLKTQDISHWNLDFWLLLKRLRSGNTGPIFPHDNKGPELHVPSNWPEASLLLFSLYPIYFLCLVWLLLAPVLT